MARQRSGAGMRPARGACSTLPCHWDSTVPPLRAWVCCLPCDGFRRSDRPLAAALRGLPRGGNGVGGAPAALMLGRMYGIVVGDWAIGSGWIARHSTCWRLPSIRPRGGGALTLGVFERERSVKHRRFEEAIDRPLQLTTTTWLSPHRATSEPAWCTPWSRIATCTLAV
jgi:hypothetical protein